MIFKEKEIILKDGRTAILRSPKPADAAAALEYMKITAAQTPFLLRTPEEITMTVDEEAKFLETFQHSDTKVMILCIVDGKLAGNCQIARKNKKKTCHRGSIGIALVQEFWNLGIDTTMFEELIAIAKQWNLMQLELEVIEGNERAMGLYRKMGFETVSYTPNAIRLSDGTLLKEFLMVKPL